MRDGVVGWRWAEGCESQAELFDREWWLPRGNLGGQPHERSGVVALIPQLTRKMEPSLGLGYLAYASALTTFAGHYTSLGGLFLGLQ